MSTTEETNKSATTKKASVRKEIPFNQVVIVLIIGDVICFLIFAAVGRNTHGEASGFAAIPQIIITALPFAIGWFLVSPFVGVFRREIVAQRIFVDHRTPPISFAIVVLLFNMALLLLWRWLFALTNSMRKRGV